MDHDFFSSFLLFHCFTFFSFFFFFSILQEGRDQQVDIVYNKIEQNLSLLGATAIEDKLQDGVPDSIANLARVREGSLFQ